MKIKSHYIFILGALLPLFLFVFPMWQITLEAPQFVEPLKMYIWVHQITGNADHTLQSVNILNHYVGMAKIEPSMFPEFKIFPYVVVGMSLLGVIIGFTRKKALFLTWGIIYVILGAIGLYDFYMWEYEYGHNLDPTAPIKIPGQSYQPPFIGGETILNFYAWSFPAIGSLFLGAGILLGFVAYWLKSKKGI